MTKTNKEGHEETNETFRRNEAFLDQRNEALLDQRNEALLDQRNEVLLDQRNEAFLDQRNEAFLDQRRTVTVRYRERWLLTGRGRSLVTERFKFLLLHSPLFAFMSFCDSLSTIFSDINQYSGWGKEEFYLSMPPTSFTIAAILISSFKMMPRR